MENKPQDWQDELKFVVDFMRELNYQTDPRSPRICMAVGLRQGGFVTSDGYLAVRRRDLTYPAYRITRSTTWKENINPWTGKHRLPVFTTGLLCELIYSNNSTIIENLPEVLAARRSRGGVLSRRDRTSCSAMPHFEQWRGDQYGRGVTRHSEGYHASGFR